MGMTYPVQPGQSLEVLGTRWKWLRALGFLCVIGGLLAIFVPVAASISAAILAGWVLLFGAAAELMATFHGHTGGQRVKHGLVGLLYAIAGLYLLLFPVSGAITLTIVLVAYFFASAAVQLATAFAEWDQGGRGWLALSGLVSIVLGILIWADFPSSGAWAIGLLLGINLLFGGWNLIFLAMAARHALDARTGRAVPIAEP
jgi:uncharacterized membrane protein HdeD (DUF308 family)